jgi:hypothetical protein
VSKKEKIKMNGKLMKAVKRQLGSTWRDDFKDIVNHGIDGGFSGFIYYSDTVSFYTRNRAEIIELVKEMADDFGQSPIEFIKSFNCLRGNDDDLEQEIAECLYGRISTDNVNVSNALAWFAAEEAAREYMNDQERDNEN